MGLRRLISQVKRHEGQLKQLAPRPYRSSLYAGGGDMHRSFAVHKLSSAPGKPSYFGSLSCRAHETEGSKDAAFLKELYQKSDPEAVIKLFETQPYLHSNSSALAEYVKALVKVYRLDRSELLKTLHRGVFRATADSKGSAGVLSAFGNVGRFSTDGVLGTSYAPIHIVTAEGGQFKEQLWRTVRALGLAFLLISGVGALLEDRGIGKRLGLHEEVQPSMDSSMKFSDVKGVDEAKPDLEEIVHYLRDPNVTLI